jgi:FkbM family methyltransferase
MTDLDQPAVRQVMLAGREASIEGSPTDTYFQKAASVAQGMEALTSLVSRHVPSGSRILDIGANIGLSTIALAWTCPDGEVVAFEPSPVNVHFLRRNLAANGVTNVTVMALAVSDQDGELRFHESPYGAGSHVVTEEHLRANWANVRVPMTTLDAAMQRLAGRPIAFAKIDAEGHEPNILAGARTMLERHEPLLYMEFNSWCLNAFGGHSPAAFARTLWRTFDLFRSDADGNLSEVEGGPLDFLHQNLLAHGCVDDLVLRLRKNVEYPTLTEMSCPSHAVVKLADLQRQFTAIETSTSWTITAPLRAVARMIKRPAS